MRSTLTPNAVSLRENLLKMILENEKVEVTCMRPDSEAHMVRDAIRAAKIHNVEPYHKLYGTVVVRIKQHKIVIERKKHQAYSDAVVKTERVTPVTLQEGIDQINDFICSPGETLMYQACPATELEAHAKSLGLLAKADGIKLVVKKPLGYKPTENPNAKTE